MYKRFFYLRVTLREDSGGVLQGPRSHVTCLFQPCVRVWDEENGRDAYARLVDDLKL